MNKETTGHEPTPPDAADASPEEPVLLRALEEDDVDRTHAWHNDPGLYATLGGAFRYVSRSAEREWLRQATSYSSASVNLAIVARASGEHIGNVYLRNIDWISRHAEVHAFVGDSKFQSRGYGGSAIRQLVRHAWNDLGLARLYLFVLEENERAIAAYAKCGFRVEGRLPRHAFKDGQFRTVLMMGLSASDQ